MNNLTLDDFELELEKAMDLSDASPQFVQSLRRKVLNAPKANRVWHPSFVWRIASISALTLTIMLFILGPKDVMAAVSQWLGRFFPGIGFVEESKSLRILEAPATIKMGGVEVTIPWAYTTDDQTIIASPLESDSRPCRDWLIYAPDTRQKIQDISLGKLRLPDGSFLEWDFNGGYQPIPAEVDEAALIIYTNKGVPECPADTRCRCMDEDQQVEIPLKFVTPPPGLDLEIYDLEFTPVAPALNTISGN